MNLNNFTIKSQEAVQQAVQLATQNGQQAIEAVHLLKGVIMTGESAVSYTHLSLYAETADEDHVADGETA